MPYFLPRPTTVTIENTKSVPCPDVRCPSFVVYVTSEVIIMKPLNFIAQYLSACEIAHIGSLTHLNRTSHAVVKIQICAQFTFDGASVSLPHVKFYIGYLTSGKRSKRQRSMSASTGLALRCHIMLIYLKGMYWAKI